MDDAIARRLKEAKPQPKPLVVVPFAEMLEPNLKTRSLVKGVLDAATLVLIFGEAGCGKTFLVLDMALHIAMGQEWFGRRVTRGRVVYVAAEAGRSIQNRVAAWAQKKCGDQDADPDFAAVVSPVDLCHLGKGDDIARLIAAIGSAQVVVVDTVSRALAGGNENAPDDMGAFVNAMDQLREKLACTVIAVHHVGKDASRGGRGHSLLHCAVDTEIMVERRDGDVCVATVTKQRDGPGGGEFAFKLVQVDLGNDQDGDSVTSCVVAPSDWVPPAKSKEPPPQAKAALAVLNRALAERGQLHPLSGDLMGRVVTLDVWREHMEKSGEFGEGKSPKFRVAWGRVQRDLNRGGHIGIQDDFVWPTRPPEEAEM